MRAKKCDRCGKLFEHYDGAKEFKHTERANAILLIDRDLDNKYWSRKSYDLYKEVAQYFQSAQGQKFLNELRQLLGRQRKQEEYLAGNREYRNRMHGR